MIGNLTDNNLNRIPLLAKRKLCTNRRFEKTENSHLPILVKIHFQEYDFNTREEHYEKLSLRVLRPF